jgi:hypothetical protein
MCRRWFGTGYDVDFAECCRRDARKHPCNRSAKIEITRLTDADRDDASGDPPHSAVLVDA